MNKYIATRSQTGKPFGIATNTSEKREWYPLDSITALKPGLTLIYVSDNPEEISLVADAKRICRPDLIIECKVQRDWYEREGLEKVKFHHNSLKPRLGSHLVSSELVPEQVYEELGEAIHILNVGFDQFKLESIIRVLMQTENED